VKTPKLTLAGTCILSLLLIGGCKGEELPPLPQGTQTITGILAPVEISIIRRGSHVLMQSGVPMSYVESPYVNLREHEGRQVKLIGVFEHNTDPRDLAVLVVKEIKALEDGVYDRFFPQFGVRFKTPSDWITKVEDGQIHFMSGDLSTLPVVSVFEDENVEELKGVTITVGSVRALRSVDELSQTESVYIKRGEKYLVLLFTPRNHPDPMKLKQEWLTLLRSLQFDEELKIPDVPTTGTGSISVYCGGPAGILCPQGYFCDVTDLQENIGVCKRVNR